ncbi:hypothetical protein [Weissella diestrammenae]|uniref:hypothetical protein n=1 Tax=Weissella diestrammenae TaxID=1162633 RepID=UPI0019618838|nr:hypothetical protein [Weissella diestrammenae]MCM0583517.1 hypothetical protein [Weissella diestrammenae]
MIETSGLITLLAGTHSGPEAIPLLILVLNFLAYVEISSNSKFSRDKLAGNVQYTTLNRSLFWFSILGGGVGAIVGAVRFKIFLNKPIFWLCSLIGSIIGILIVSITLKFLILPIYF